MSYTCGNTNQMTTLDQEVYIYIVSGFLPHKHKHRC